tara:strand:- start:867 stop:2198 length:1332 start_codon:yes stop_codon:yes gene_type:complete
MPSGGGGSTQTVQKADPWSGIQPYLSHGYSEAERLYGAGGPQYYPGQTYVDYAPETEQALQAGAQRAYQGSPTLQAGNQFLTNLIGGNFGMGPSAQQLSPMASGANVGRDLATQSLGGMAAGDYLNANPYLDRMFDKASGQVEGAVRGHMGRIGRVGSGTHQETLQRGLGNLATDIYGGNYGRERGLQTQAAGTLGGLLNQQFGQQLGASQVMQGAFQDALGRQTQGAALAPSFAAADYGDIDRLRDFGGAYEAKSGEALQDVIGRHAYQQQQPYENLQRYLANIGAGTSGGGTTTTSQQQGLGLGDVMGTGLMGYGLGQNLGLFGAGTAVAGGATAASMAGAMAAGVPWWAMMPMGFGSDRAIKSDIEPLDEEMLAAIAKLPISTWRYTVDDRRHIGPMAQDVHELFGIGDGKTINIVDAIGTMYATMKAMVRRIEELERAG